MVRGEDGEAARADTARCTAKSTKQPRHDHYGWSWRGQNDAGKRDPAHLESETRRMPFMRADGSSCETAFGDDWPGGKDHPSFAGSRADRRLQPERTQSAGGRS